MNKIDEILSLTIEKCRDRFITFSKVEGVTAEQVPSAQLSAMINHRSEIFLYGVDLTVRFQVIYSDILFQPHVAPLFDSVNEAKVRDFFNEICNLSLGKMKEILVEQGIMVALSLPVDIDTTRERVLGAEEVLTHSRLCRLHKGSETLCYVKVALEIHRQDVVDAFNSDIGDKESEDGEIEFF